ncbi:Acb2/Tad1 domain-containing protein [Microbacterium sp. Ag1]|uniref:Acb2/Tad1 domain-containing protein n=1 Tax=Microbacterium sp. Ag1 TaxID=1643443 RepID=UPI000629835A|nr:hypothetical protein [Microbacterium sp. Ag1]KKX96696.1 hypothetical protein AAY78_15365 [Microbacterium sp. Ag1]
MTKETVVPVPAETPVEQTPTPLPPELASRFVTAATSEAPSQDQVAIVRQNAGAITTAAEQLAQLPDSRYKSLALTSLEEALMWANKAVFQ